MLHNHPSKSWLGFNWTNTPPALGGSELDAAGHHLQWLHAPFNLRLFVLVNLRLTHCLPKCKRVLLHQQSGKKRVFIHYTQILLSSIVGRMVFIQYTLKQERESLRTSQQDFYGALFHWSTASSDSVPEEVRGIPGMEDNQPVQLTQMGYSSESDPMLSFMGNIKFQRKASLQAHVLRFLIYKSLKMLMIRLFISFSQGFLPASLVRAFLGPKSLKVLHAT